MHLLKSIRCTSILANLGRLFPGPVCIDDAKTGRVSALSIWFLTCSFVLFHSIRAYLDLENVLDWRSLVVAVPFAS